MSKLEALIDFSDEELPTELEQVFYFKVTKILEEMEKAVKHSNYGERIRNGFVITLIGHPNVGKSSLINYLSDKKVVSLKEILALTNLSENYSAAELVDASLSKIRKSNSRCVECFMRTRAPESS